MQADFLPVLPLSDIEQAAFLIQSAYIPGQNAEESRRMQQQLFEIQKRPEAWGLVLPLLDHPDPNVEFFGAHTAQVKIVRDWDTFPQEHALPLVHVLLTACTQAIAGQKSRVTLRKLFVAVTSLALKLVPGRPPRWPDWILSVVTSLSGGGARPENILEFLEIAAEEVGSSDLISTSKAQMQQSLLDAASIVTEAVKTSLLSPNTPPIEHEIAFKCLEAWVAHLTGNHLTSLIPIIIQLLSNERTFVGASGVLEEILSSSSFSDGSGIKILTEPIMAFLETDGTAIVQRTMSTGEVDEVSHSLCKLLVALGEHSINYIASHLSMPHVQTFVRLLITYTALPGYYGVDEDESEMTLSFWYLLQEALWSVDYDDDPAESALADWAGSLQGTSASQQKTEERERNERSAATPIYAELIQVLKRKVTWPSNAELAKWRRDQFDKFQVYRRDVGDTLINAYYILRQEMLRIYVDDLVATLNSRGPNDGWESVEATLHCIMSVQEAVELAPNPHLERLFGPEVLGRLPRTDDDRVRKTTLNLIGTYSTWFTVPVDNRYLLGALSYVAEALDELVLCLPAANALRDLCDANRLKLADHIAEFGQLHARLASLPDSEQAKIIQSIASVIQALPPEQQIEPVEAIVNPIIADLVQAIDMADQYSDDARSLANQQLQALTGAAKGLTRTTDILFAYDDDKQLEYELERLEEAREDLRILKIRIDIIECVRSVTMRWSQDASTADAMNGLIVAITSLPADVTMLSLPPVSLLEIVCVAMFRHPSAVWYSLAAMLIHQLDPPSLTSLISVPEEFSVATVRAAMPIILESCFRCMRPRGAMQANPDIVQSFFGCMEMVAQHFAEILFELPPGGTESLMRFTVKALALQERYSLVAASKFLVYAVNRTVAVEALEERGRELVRNHFKPVLKAVLCGIAGGAPTSTAQNLVDLLLALVTRCPNECRTWVPEILFSNDFIPTKARREDKEKFAKAVLSSRSTKKMREAAQQFALVAKGLEGSSFGYASVTM